MNNERIDSLDLNFSTENKEDASFLIECMTLLAGTVVLLRQMREGHEKVGEIMSEGANERDVAPIVRMIGETQEQLFMAVDIFAGMVLSRQMKVDVAKTDIHDAPAVVQ